MALHKLPGEYTYDGVTMCEAFPANILDRIKDSFKLRDDDVLVCTYPKAGTTWFLEIVWLIMNEADVSKAKEINQAARAPYLESTLEQNPMPIDILEAMKTPRIIKTHLQFKFFEKQLREKKTKVVLGARNIKDTLVSLYHFYRMNASLGSMKGPFSEFFQLFTEKHLAFGDWFDFNLGYWNNRKHYELFVLKYEDLHKDLEGTIQKLAEFLERDLNQEQIKSIASHVSFQAMLCNDNVNHTNKSHFKHEISQFMRKGEVGDWKNYLTKEQEQYVDELYNERVEGSGLEFDFEV